MSHTILEMLTVMTKTTMRAAISMEVTVVDQMLTPNGVQIVFVMNKRRNIIRVGSKQLFKLIVFHDLGNNLLT